MSDAQIGTSAFLDLRFDLLPSTRCILIADSRDLCQLLHTLLHVFHAFLHVLFAFTYPFQRLGAITFGRGRKRLHCIIFGVR